MKKIYLTVAIALCAMVGTDAATFFSEDFSGGASPNMAMTDSIDRAGYTGSLQNNHLDYAGDNAAWEDLLEYRQYIRTTDSDYLTVDFRYEATVTIAAGSSAWADVMFGMGNGTAVAPHGEPEGPNIGISPEGGSTFTRYILNGVRTRDGRSGGVGTHRLRMDWNATTQMAEVSIDQNYNGTFAADGGYTLAGANAGGIDANNSYLFVGGGEGIVVDDISVSSPLDFYGAWAAGYGLDPNGNGARAEDADVDGMENLLEYVLGGNPNIDDAATILPTSEFTLGTIEYIYNRRLDAVERGLTYGLSVNTNGLETAGEFVGTDFETATGVVDANFESVTNSIPITGVDLGFVNLEVTEN